MERIRDSVTRKHPQVAQTSSGQIDGGDIGLTRATMDQRRRAQRVLLQEKKMRIKHLKTRCENIAAEVNEQFEVLTEKLLHYKGDPNWLIECFSIIFNESSATVQENEAEIKQLYKEVAELKNAVHRTVEEKQNGPSSSQMQKIPRTSKSSVQMEKNRHRGNISASEVFGFPVSVNQFSLLQSSQPTELQSPE